MEVKSYTNAVLSSVCKGQVLNRTVLLFQKPAISPGESNLVLFQKLIIKLTFHCGSSTILKQEKERRELSVSSLSFCPENSQVARRVKYVFVKQCKILLALSLLQKHTSLRARACWPHTQEGKGEDKGHTVNTSSHNTPSVRLDIHYGFLFKK